jgi:glutamate 5-kinase
MTYAGAAGDRSWFSAIRRCVIKIGSQALLDEAQRLDERPIISLVKQVSALRAQGREVVLVSSGAVAAGLPGLNLDRRPTDLPSLQAAAAVGQAQLMEVYRRHFFAHGIVVAQVLLTHPDLRSRERQLNARNTLNRLLQAGVVPIINENDTVAVDEIRVGDNDILSALVATMLHADVVILLTSASGVYDGPPSSGGKVIPTIARVDDAVYALVSPTRTSVGVGGMRTKLQAADMMARCGEHAIIAGAAEPNVLIRLFAGEAIGTQFLPREEKLEGRKRWIAFFDRPRGALHVDDGAAKALTTNGKSLLPIGIRLVEGTFDRGDPVRILDAGGREIARGLVNYSAEHARAIAGRASKDIAAILGVCEFPEVVHRDNLVLA